MEQKEIIKGNKLIAEFMGVFKKEGEHLHLWVKNVEDLIGEPMPTDIDALCLKFKYHTSWDWLMPVYKKFRSLEGMKMPDWLIHCNSIENWIVRVDIKTAFKYLVESIRWYNSTPHKKTG